MPVILDNFKGKGHCIMMDSTYMGDIMAQIGCKEWKMNMVGTSQSNQTGADVKNYVYVKKMKHRTYELCFWQCTTKDMMFMAWSDNAIVKTL